MRNLIIKQMNYYLGWSLGDSGRWAPANSFLAEKMGGIQKFGKKGLKQFDITRQTDEMTLAIEQLNDLDLITLFEIVLRRFSQQRG